MLVAEYFCPYDRDYSRSRIFRTLCLARPSFLFRICKSRYRLTLFLSFQSRAKSHLTFPFFVILSDGKKLPSRVSGIMVKLPSSTSFVFRNCNHDFCGLCGFWFLKNLMPWYATGDLPAKSL